MPRVVRRESGRLRRSWDHDCQLFLIHGMTLDHNRGWGIYWRKRLDEIPQEVRAEMEACWSDLGDEIMAEWDEHNSPGQRPWGFFAFECPAPRDWAREEAEQLDELGLLEPSELASLESAARLRHVDHAVKAFRRSWAWWRFLTPQPRDKSISEVEQLLNLGDDLLSDREQYIIEHKNDVPIPRAPQWRNDDAHEFLGLTDDERTLLGLPAISNDVEDEDEDDS